MTPNGTTRTEVTFEMTMIGFSGFRRNRRKCWRGVAFRLRFPFAFWLKFAFAFKLTLAQAFGGRLSFAFGLAFDLALAFAFRLIWRRGYQSRRGFLHIRPLTLIWFLVNL